MGGRNWHSTQDTHSLVPRLLSSRKSLGKTHIHYWKHCTCWQLYAV